MLHPVYGRICEAVLGVGTSSVMTENLVRKIIILWQMYSHTSSLSEPLTHQLCALDYLATTMNNLCHQGFTCLYHDLEWTELACGDYFDMNEAWKVYIGAEYEAKALDFLQSYMEAHNRAAWKKFVAYWRDQ